MSAIYRGIVYEDRISRHAPHVGACRTPATLPCSEKLSLAGSEPEVELLKSKEDIARASITEDEAMRHDPVFTYAFDPPDMKNSWWHGVFMKAYRTRQARVLKYKAELDQAFQVYHGDAIAVL
ncbi:hypothetical protein FA95DRAFT_1558419 [Auriscalpium vulgare]|uniref:Uncharacterized protein n=1 Tax=Auriscalpium vulgare TaxID=40419 RepID=A0ACB8RWP7_9AGAM|nr:hypothetical protein FA95DRAFT_1558419 [Auriscalpium vulgare]